MQSELRGLFFKPIFTSAPQHYRKRYGTSPPTASPYKNKKDTLEPLRGPESRVNRVGIIYSRNPPCFRSKRSGRRWGIWTPCRPLREASSSKSRKSARSHAAVGKVFSTSVGLPKPPLILLEDKIDLLTSPLSRERVSESNFGSRLWRWAFAAVFDHQCRLGLRLTLEKLDAFLLK